MDPERVLLCISVAFALAVGIFILWGPSTRSRRRPGHICGLVNLGYTCFLNTLLQALASCPLMLDWLAHCHGAAAQSLTEAMHTALLVLNGCHGQVWEDPYTPSSVIHSLLAQGWVISPGEQDAHELFHVLMATLEEEAQAIRTRVSLSDAVSVPIPNRLSHLNRPPREIHSDTTDLHFSSGDKLRGSASATASCPPQGACSPPFQGLLTSQLQCTACSYKSAVLYDKFDSLSLPLPGLNNVFLQRLTLLQLLDNFVSTEVVKDFICEGCNGESSGHLPIKADALKTLNFGKLPKCLCIHIQRTTWQESGQASKRVDYIEFPEFLCMDAYTYTRIQKRKIASLKCHENGDQPEQNNLCNNVQLRNLRPSSMLHSVSRLKHLYRLSAVIVHTGDVESGHFVTYRRSLFRENNWYYTSDCEVRESSLHEAMQACAYMLFYNKCT